MHVADSCPLPNAKGTGTDEIPTYAGRNGVLGAGNAMPNFGESIAGGMNDEDRFNALQEVAGENFKHNIILANACAAYIVSWSCRHLFALDLGARLFSPECYQFR